MKIQEREHKSPLRFRDIRAGDCFRMVSRSMRPGIYIKVANSDRVGAACLEDGYLIYPSSDVDIEVVNLECKEV